jgi:hypothetical protein
MHPKHCMHTAADCRNTMQVDKDASIDLSLNEEYIIAQGLWQTRELINWLYRRTAVTTKDQMDIRDIQENIRHTHSLHEFLVSSFITLSILVRSHMALSCF